MRRERESRVLANLACALYAGEVLPLGKAAELAGMDRFCFAAELEAEFLADAGE